VSADGLPVGEWSIPDSDLEEIFSTPGGPGGQHANRNETAVTLRLNIPQSSLPEEVKAKLVDRLSPVVEVNSSESRSQWRNRALARKRMAEKLEAALVDLTPRKPTKPSRSADLKRLDAKKERSQTKRRRRPPGPDD